MEHGIVPRPRFTKCPTAYCAPSQHARPISIADQAALRAHAVVRDAKLHAALARSTERGRYAAQFSSRNRSPR